WVEVLKLKQIAEQLSCVFRDDDRIGGVRRPASALQGSVSRLRWLAPEKRLGVVLVGSGTRGLAIGCGHFCAQSTVPLQTRVGIATGVVVVGDLIGSGAGQRSRKRIVYLRRMSALAAP